VLDPVHKYTVVRHCMADLLADALNTVAYEVTYYTYLSPY